MKTSILQKSFAALFFLLSATAFAEVSGPLDEDLPASKIPTGSTLEFTRDVYVQAPPAGQELPESITETLGQTSNYSCKLIVFKAALVAGKNTKISSGMTKQILKTEVFKLYDAVRFSIRADEKVAVQCAETKHDTGKGRYPSIKVVREILDQAGIVLNITNPVIDDAVEL